MGTLSLHAGPIEIADVVEVARAARRVVVADASRVDMEASRAGIAAALSDGLAHYGINTGFGSLSRTRIAPAEIEALQRNLVRSHAAGVGIPLPDDVVRAMMVVLAASLARGRSGVRPVVVDRIVAWLNAGLAPIVPEVGSVGASGDLAPLAHVALALMGEGRVRAAGRSRPAGDALREAGIEPLALEAKEGLALINGTHLMAGRGALLAHDARRLIADATVACAMAIDACRATDAFLDERLHDARRQPGPARIAAALRSLLARSQIVPSHRDNDPRVQDPYSLRCSPQVIGASADALAYVRACVERELGGVTDNPLVFPARDGGWDILSGGNFHGMPLALPLDHLTPAIAQVAGIAERRVYFLLSATDPQNPVDAYLAPHPGVQSGYMIAQYAAAACVNEIATLAFPASVVNVPTSAGVEDYNSFGPRAAAKAARAIDLARYVVAIELMCAAQGIEYKRPLRSGDGVELAIEVVRSVVPRLTGDRPPGEDAERLAGALAHGALAQLDSSP